MRRDHSSVAGLSAVQPNAHLIEASRARTTSATCSCTSVDCCAASDSASCRLREAVSSCGIADRLRPACSAMARRRPVLGIPAHGCMQSILVTPIQRRRSQKGGTECALNLLARSVCVCKRCQPLYGCRCDTVTGRFREIRARPHVYISMEYIPTVRTRWSWRSSQSRTSLLQARTVTKRT